MVNVNSNAEGYNLFHTYFAFFLRYSTIILHIISSNVPGISQNYCVLDYFWKSHFFVISIIVNQSTFTCSPFPFIL